MQPLTIRCVSADSETVATIVPHWGANVIGMSYQKREWQHPVSFLEDVSMETVSAKPTSYGVPILCPTPGRVGINQSGKFVWQGSEQTISPTRHGFLRDMAWEAAEVADDHLRCEVAVSPAGEAPAFPFTFHASAEFAIGVGYLDIRLTLTNTGQSIQPLNAGFHPYIKRPQQCRVKIPAKSILQLDEEDEPTPNGEWAAVAGNTDFRDGRDLDPDEHWDHIFTDISSESGHSEGWIEGPEEILLQSGSRRPHQIRRSVRVATGSESCGLRHLQLYTPNHRKAICIEPLSCVPNAINLVAEGSKDFSFCVVPVGGSVCFRLRLSVSALPAGS